MTTALIGLLLALLLGLACAGAASARAAAGAPQLVDVFAGTQPGGDTFGGGHNFPGASAPFGMLQWSPDTTPSAPHSSGYDYRDRHVTGFSLTQLSGAGCSLYGDFPFMPTTEPLAASPAKPGGGLQGMFEPGFSHGSERGRPGFYSTRLNPVHGGGIGVALTAGTRAGIGRFVFPANPHASVLVDAGGSAEPDDLAGVEVNPGRREISGTASSGLFCGQRPRYRVYFAAVFDRPFDASGTWMEGSLRPGGKAASDHALPPANPSTTAQAGAYATFDTRRRRAVTVHVGISFVSVDGARANLAAEAGGGTSFGELAGRTARSWRQELGRIRVSGGSRRRQAMFYTALYHAFLAPRTFDDVDGSYMGMDGAVHQTSGHGHYADFSGWDVYRTQIALLALLDPKRAGDMMRSLIADARESGCLPRWSYATGQSMTMVGDPADPMLASAAAFGAHFNQEAALQAMVRGATEPCRTANGEYLQRQGLLEYLHLGYVPFDMDVNKRNANSIYGDPEAVWGSAATTLEYAIDDFAIARLAARLGDRGTYRTFVRRAGNWRRLFNSRKGMIEPRFSSGAFPQPYDDLRGGGFVEGNAAQYTWMVPHDPAGLAKAMGGRGRAAARLGRFLRDLNAGPGGTHTGHALLGNEPTLHTPWLYDWLGRPYRTQEAVRRALSLYSPAPDGYPGNDDLGTLSAWYVFSSLGLYPEIPGSGTLALASPAFPRAEVRLPHGRRALLVSSGHGPYVRSLRLNGRGHGRPWTTYCAVARGATLSFQLSARPNRRWGSGAAAAPPSFNARTRMPHGSCAP